MGGLVAYKDRIYSMTRISAGDYLLLDNDRSTIWRIQSYVEDGSAGNFIDGKWVPVRGTFWRSLRYRGTITEAREDEHFEDIDRWLDYSYGYRTRRAAAEDVCWRGR